MNCVICGKKFEDKIDFPFCSTRCRHVDLYNWFNGIYAKPHEELYDMEEAENSTNNKDL